MGESNIGVMSYRSEDYTFGGLLNNNMPTKDTFASVINTLAYIVGLSNSETSGALDLKMASKIIGDTYDFEEQARSAEELIEYQRGARFPAGYFPQTPVMLAHRWSPISTMLDCGMEPIALNRAKRVGLLCASGIWNINKPLVGKDLKHFRNDEDLFWHILGKVIEKAKADQYLISIIAKPGWSYEHGQLQNLTLAEARKANRVVWQRTPR
jgi:hypothetical protein